MSNATILCVDDERNVLLTLRTQLLRHFPDYTIEIAESATEALGLVDELMAAGEEMPLVIADQIMPGMKGDQLLIELHVRYPQMLKVMLTGQAQAEDVGNAVNQANLYRFIAKPWNETDLILTVTEALRRYQQEQQLRQQQLALEATNQRLVQLNGKLEQKVQERTQQLRLFVENTPAAVAMFDRDMRYLLVSRRWTIDYELGDQEIIGRSHYDVFPNLPDRWKESHQRCLAGASEQCDEDQFVRADGSVIWNQWEIHPWYDDVGDIGGIILFTQVITDRKLAEISLRESEHRYAALATASPVGIFRNDANGAMIYANDRWCQITGLTLAQAQGKGWLACVHPDWRERLLQEWEYLVQTGQRHSMESCLQLPNGDLKWVYCQVQPEQDQDGTIVGYVGTLTDMTQQRRLELAFRSVVEKTSGVTEEQFFSALTHGLVEALGVDHAITSRLIDGQFHTLAFWSNGQFLPQLIYAPEDASACAAVIKYGVYSCPKDAQRHHPDNQYLRSLKAESYLGVALLGRNGQPIGHLCIIDSRPLVNDNQILTILQLFATRAAAELERQVASHALKQSEAELRSLFAAMDDVVMVLDRNGIHLKVISTHSSNLYQPSEGVIGRSLHDVFAAEQADLFLTHIQQALRSGQTQDCEYSLLIGQTERWFNAKCSPLTTDTVLWVARDITDRKQIEAALQASQASLVAAQHIAHVGNWAFEVATQKVTWSEELFHLYGRDPSQWQPTYGEFQQQVHPDDWPPLEQAIHEALVQGRPYEIEHRVICPDGSMRYALSKGEATYNAQGQVIRLFGTTQDITLAKQAEAALRASEERYRLLSEISPVGIFRNDLQGRCIYANAKALEMTGLSLEETLGDGWGKYLHPDDRDWTSAAWMAFVEQVKLGQPASYQVEHRYLYPDGSLRWAFSQSVPEYSVTGTLVGLIGSVIDITERKQAEDALRHSEANQRALISALPDLIMRVSRDGVYRDFIATDAFKLLGEGSEVIGSRVEETLPPELAAQRMVATQAALDTGTMQIYEQELWIDGVAQIEECRVVAANQDEVIILVRDITDRKQAEAALVAAEAQQRSILENIPSFVVKVDRAGRMLFVNRLAEGFAQEHVIGSHINDYTAPASRELQQSAIEQVFVTGQTVTIETLGTGNAGHPAYYEVRIAPIHTAGQITSVILVATDITDRKQAEATLQEREQQVISLLNNIPHMAWLKDHESRFLAVNAPLGEACGYDISELVGLTDLDIWPRDLAEAYRRDDLEVMASRQQKRLEERLVTATGEEQWIETIKTPILNDRGEAIGTTGIAMDVTHRKQIEEKLKKLNEELELRVQERTQELQSQTFRLQLALEVADMGIWESDQTTEIWSERTEAIFGYAPGTFPGDREAFLKLVHVDDQERVLQALIHSFFTRSPYRVEYRIHRLDGEMRWIAVRGKIVPQNAGSEVRMVGILLDITERKQAEDALHLSQEQMQLALEGSGDGVWDWDITTGAAYLSPRWLSILGYEVGELTANVDTWNQLLHPDDRPQVMAVLEAHFQDGSVPYQVQYRAKTKTGEWKWLANYGRVVARDANGRPLRMVGLQRDITDRKQAETELQEKEQFLRSIYEGTENPIFVIDVLADGNFRYVGWSPACARFSGVPTAAALGKSPIELMGPDQGAALSRNYHRCIQAGQALRYEESLVFDTTTVWTLTTLNPLRNAAGEIYRIVGTAVDITTLKTAEANLEAERLRLQLALDAAQMATWSCNLQTGQLRWSDRAQEIFGFVPGTFPGDRETFLAMVDPEDYHRVTQAIAATFEQGDPYHIEYRIHRRDGELRWVAVWGLIPAQSTPADRQLVGVVTDITDRKHAEAALQQSEVRLRATFNQAAVGIVQVDLQGQFQQANQKFCEIVGYSAAELLCKSFIDITHPEDRAASHVNVMQLLAGKISTFVMEKRYVRKDGGTVWVTLSVSLVRSYSNQPDYLIAVIQDITDRKQAEAALQQSEQDLRMIFNNVYDAILIHDLDGTIVDMNDRALELRGATREQLLAAKIPDLSAPDAPLEHLPDIWQQVQNGATLRFEWREQRLSDRVCFDVEVSLRKTTLGNRPVIIAGVRDISDRKRAETALQQSEAQLRATFNQAAVGIVQTDLQGRFTQVNQKFCEIVGYPEPELILRSFGEITHPADLAADHANVRQLLAGNTSTFIMEKRYIRKDGETVWVALAVSLVRDPAHRPEYFVGVVQDITDRKQAEAALRQLNLELEDRVEQRTAELQEAKDAAEAANRAKSIFLANMSHELRTPLNAILGFSQLLNRDEALGDEQQKQVEIINRSGEHLLNLINDILEMSKIEAGRVSLTITSVDLHDILRSLDDLFRLKAESKGLNLRFQCDQTVPQYIQVDAGKLRQVLINLLGNAVKFTQTGDVTLQVSLAQHSRHPLSDLPTLCFAVQDTGPGIAPDEQVLLFEPFVQTQTGKQAQEGTGLGLPISRQFVWLMGGDLTVHSRLGQGSTFQFEIPVELAQVEQLSPRLAHQKVIGLAPGQAQYRLLVVEDNSENRQFLVQLLQEIGFEVRAAEHGQAAIEQWQEWEPHLIWMDMRMPVMDGYTATQEIRRLEKQLAKPSTKILALTASAFEDERVAILAAGCDDFVCKPATEAVLLERLAEHLGVTYFYEQEPTPTATDGSSAESQFILSADALRGMPADWIAQLQWAVRIADDELILQLLEQLPPSQAAVHQALRDLVHDLRLDQLLELAIAATTSSSDSS